MVSLLYYLYLKCKLSLFDIEVIRNKSLISSEEFNIVEALIKDKQQRDLDMIREK